MKKNSFTLLAILMLVTVSAVAEEQDTEPVSISATIGAKSFVCSKALDFSSFNSNNSGSYDFNLVPYYISSYNVTSGLFNLTRFSNDQVPANTPMILLGKQHSNGTFPGNVKNFDVPVLDMADADATTIKETVWSNNYAWLVPVIRDSYDEYICLKNVAGKSEKDAKNRPIMSHVIFYDNTGIPENAKLMLSQTEDVQVKEREDTAVVNQYYDSHEFVYSKNIHTAIFGGSPLFVNDYYDEEDEEDYDGIGITGNLGDQKVFWTENSKKTKVAYALYEYRKFNEGGTDIFFWAALKSKSKTAEDKYDEDAGEWIASSEEVISYTPILASYTQYFLGANGTTPVFKKCRADGSNGVNYGGAYVRVWSELLGGAAAREDVSFQIFDEDGTEIAYQNDDVTGIRSLQNTVDAKKENRQVYNLQGQKLDKMKPGLNIVNGKKYFVK